MSSAFDQGGAPPDDASLARVLGRSRVHWEALVSHLGSACDGVVLEWKYYGRKHGWQLKALRRKRALVFLVPHSGSFLAGLALNEAAVEALRAGRFPAALVEEVSGSNRYPEGRPARVEVTSKRQADVVRRLVELKLASL